MGIKNQRGGKEIIAASLVNAGKSRIKDQEVKEAQKKYSIKFAHGWDHKGSII